LAQGKGSLATVSRAMIVVAAGSGSRFERDKILTPVDGKPLIAITVARVKSHVDQCVLVCRADQAERIQDLDLGVTIAVGGPTRTTSEIAGLSALEKTPELIGIHDGARPNLSPPMVEELFETARSIGGAVPVVPAGALLLDRETLSPVEGVMAVQTPQVFRGEELVEAMVKADAESFSGDDTVDIVHRYTDLEVAAVDGDPTNIKVTYPGDLARVIPL
jgi:2-C-methyl-D-erythritol 4-phosphate cytidylyltransferase